MATMTLSDMVFQNYSTKVALLITSSGTYTLDNCLFDQSGTYDIEIDSGVTGDTTIILQNGTTALVLGDIDNNGSGSVTIQNNVTVQVTVKTASEQTAIQNARVLVLASSGGDLPFEDSVTIARSGSTATVTHTSHGLVDDMYVLIEGAVQNQYNGIKKITVTTVNAYTFSVSGSPDTPATGTITSTSVILQGYTDINGQISDTHNFTSSQPIAGRARKSSSGKFYLTTGISGTITASGYDSTLGMVEDGEQPTNIFLNGTWDSWISGEVPNNWSYTELLGGNLQREDTEVWEGTYSARMILGASGSVEVYQNVILLPSERYTLTCWHNYSLGTLHNIGSVEIRDTGSNQWWNASTKAWQGSFADFDLYNSGDWEQDTMRFFAHPDYSVYRIVISMYYSSSTCYLDQCWLWKTQQS